QQVSVMGFDDMMFTEWVDPALTTVRQPFTAMGAAALELLEECLAGGDQPPRQRVLDCELIVRASTGAV
ncbi:MAG: substrate-binding domain-containing protein, partial [Armatimonadota bacterium]